MSDPPEMWGEDDWLDFFLSLEDTVYDAFTSLLSLFEVSRDFAECFCPVNFGHIRQYSDQLDHGQLVSAGQLGEVYGDTPERVLNPAA